MALMQVKENVWVDPAEVAAIAEGSPGYWIIHLKAGADGNRATIYAGQLEATAVDAVVKAAAELK